MARLCPTLALGCVLVAGCTGQTMEGAWRGPLPYAGATDCLVKMFADSRFEVSCQRDTWLGTGRWERSGENLTFRYTALAKDGKVIDRPVPMEFSFVGEGNTLALKDPTGVEYRWTRGMGGD